MKCSRVFKFVSIFVFLLAVPLFFAGCVKTEAKEPTEEETHEHQFTEWVTIKEPTYTESGEETRYCIIDNYTETRPIPKLQEPPVVDVDPNRIPADGLAGAGIYNERE